MLLSPERGKSAPLPSQVISLSWPGAMGGGQLATPHRSFISGSILPLGPSAPMFFQAQEGLIASFLHRSCLSGRRQRLFLYGSWPLDPPLRKDRHGFFFFSFWE